MRYVVLGMRNAVRCEIWCYGDMVIWPALQARVVLWFVVCRRSSSFVIPKKSSQLCTLLRARACPSNGIWRICDFDFWHDKSI